MRSCTAHSVYVGGEKIATDKYSVLRLVGGEWVLVEHWRDMPLERERVLVVPAGVAHDPLAFPQASWSASANQAEAKGKHGRKASRGWSDEDLYAVALTRAHGVGVGAPGARSTRDAIVSQLTNGGAHIDLARAGLTSSDPRIAGLSLSIALLSQEQLRAFSQSPSIALRVRAAQMSGDSRLLSTLANDPHPVVRQAAARNTSTPTSVIDKLANDKELFYEIASNRATSAEVILDMLELGGIEARAAITHPRAFERADRAIRLESPLAAYAARNPNLDLDLALQKASTSAEIAISLATNREAVQRLNEEQAILLLNTLKQHGALSSISAVCRYAKFSTDTQAQLLTTPYNESVAIGLAASPYLGRSESEMLLDGTALYPDEVADQVRLLLADNPRTTVRALLAMDISSPAVARSLSNNSSVSSAVRDDARAVVRLAEDHTRQVLQDALDGTSYTLEHESRRIVNNASSGRGERPVGSIALGPDVCDTSLRVPADWGLSSWGGRRLELQNHVSRYGHEVVLDTRVLLRVDERQSKSLTGANAHTDPLGILIEQDGRKHFELLLPVKETEYDTPELIFDAASSEEMLARDRRREIKDAVARLDKEAAVMAAVSYIPVVGRHADKVKLLVQAERRLTGVATGIDRVAYISVDASAGGVMRILEPEYKRDEAFTQAKSFVADLVTRGELTAQEGDGVTIALEQVDAYAKNDSEGLTLSRRYAEMLRFKTGQAEVVERLLHNDVEWLI